MEIINELALGVAVESELSTRSGLLPPRPDLSALVSDVADVERILAADFRRRSKWGTTGSVVFANKVAKGTRPLTVMTLHDRILYRALVDRLAAALPEHLRSRDGFGEFEQMPNKSESAKYVTALDVSSYYVYVDHELLVDELIAQTGDSAAVEALADLLERVMGRRVGLPQVSPVSDVLGDTHLDIVRRKLVRRGFDVARYADDFRIATETLGEARRALEECSSELYALGLVLNDYKTLTFGIEKYRESITRFKDAERQLFVDEDHNVEELDTLLSVHVNYGSDTAAASDATSDTGEDSDVETDQSEDDEQTLLQSPVDSREVVESIDEGPSDPVGNPTNAVVRAATRAWQLWEEGEVSHGYDDAVRRTMAARALRVLGRAGDTLPLASLDKLMRQEPGLTPDVVAYLISIPKGKARIAAREAVDDLLNSQPILSTWQKIWIAHAVGNMGRFRRTVEGADARFRKRPSIIWLQECLQSNSDGLVSTAASSLGQLRIGVPAELASAVETIGEQWRSLALWGLGKLDEDAAVDCSDGALERLIVGHV